MTTDEKKKRRKIIVNILASGLLRVVDSLDKSSDISKLRENKDSQNVAYGLDFSADKSVCRAHESN